MSTMIWFVPSVTTDIRQLLNDYKGQVSDANCALAASDLLLPVMQVGEIQAAAAAFAFAYRDVDDYMFRV